MINPKVTFFSGHALQSVDFTPATAVNAGDVILINNVAYFAALDIPAGQLGALVFSGGAWFGNKTTGAWTLGDQIYYNPTGSPVNGAAGSGAFNNAGAGTFVGVCVASPNTAAGALNGDSVGYFVKSLTAGTGNSSAYTVAATGSTQADAAPLASGFDLVTGADATKGVILPAGSPGRTVEVKNSDTANAILKVYPPTGGTINALAANGAISMAAKTAATFRCAADGVSWFTIPLVPS